MINRLRIFQAAVKDRFNQLGARDQRAALVLLAVIAGVFCWLGIYRPIEAARQESEQSLREARRDYEWINAHQGEAAAIRADMHASAPADTAAMLSAVTGAAEMNHIAVSHAAPAGAGTAQFYLDHVSYRQLIVFLDTLSRASGIRVKEASIQRIEAEPGAVSATLTLQSR